MKKVMLVFGTRPEAIKMCPLVNELKKRTSFITEVCVTGQHGKLIDPILRTFGVVPDFDLTVMREDRTLFDITGDILNGLKPVLEKEKPDIVLVHGDTTTAFAAALSGFYLKIPVGHVEAGLRTYNAGSPYPEEFNRRSVDIISGLCFAPTRLAADNLIKEGINPGNIFVTGNTVVDSVRCTSGTDYSHPELDWAKNGRMIFITSHRRENLGEPMHRMFRAIRRVLDEHPGCRAVYPIHPNPEIRKIAEDEFRGCGNIHITEPLDVTGCRKFEEACYLCLTDSGGIQEECPLFGKPVLVMRDVTERPEGVLSGNLRLVGTDEESVYRNFSELLDNPAAYDAMAKAGSPFGDGQACGRIADIIENRLTVTEKK